MHTIDPSFILGIAQISEFGSRKYHMRNFLMAPGMAWSDVYGSLMRHLLAFWGGDELDLGPNGEFGPTDDPATNMKWSGLPHIYHVAWNVMVLATYSTRPVYAPGDDRPSTLEYVGGIWKDWETEFDEIRGIAEKGTPVAEERRSFVNRNVQAGPLQTAIESEGKDKEQYKTNYFNRVLNDFLKELDNRGVDYNRQLVKGGFAVKLENLKPENRLDVQQMVGLLSLHYSKGGYKGDIKFEGDYVIIKI